MDVGSFHLQGMREAGRSVKRSVPVIGDGRNIGIEHYVDTCRLSQSVPPLPPPIDVYPTAFRSASDIASGRRLPMVPNLRTAHGVTPNSHIPWRTAVFVSLSEKIAILVLYNFVHRSVCCSSFVQRSVPYVCLAKREVLARRCQISDARVRPSGDLPPLFGLGLFSQVVLAGSNRRNLLCHVPSR